MPTKRTVPNGRTRTDVIGCIASLVDALACLIFLIWQTNLTNVGRAFIGCVVDPITCMIGYWAIYRRLRQTAPILAETGVYLLVLGTFLLTYQNAVEELGNLNFFPLNYVSAKELDALFEILVAFSLPFGLGIDAWLIASSQTLRRWLGFMIGIEVVVLFIDLVLFNVPGLTEFVSSQLLTVYAIILAIAKAVWFLSPEAGSKRAVR